MATLRAQVKERLHERWKHATPGALEHVLDESMSTIGPLLDAAEQERANLERELYSTAEQVCKYTRECLKAEQERDQLRERVLDLKAAETHCTNLYRTLEQERDALRQENERLKAAMQPLVIQQPSSGGYCGVCHTVYTGTHMCAGGSPLSGGAR